jgi:hypothetical protein
MYDRHFSTFYIAGFTYNDGVDVFEHLKIGTELLLKAEPKNRFDPNAVGIYYKSTKIGFVPRDGNDLISKFLNFGHTNVFEVKISQVSPEAHPEKQIRVQVRIRDVFKENDKENSNENKQLIYY